MASFITSLPSWALFLLIFMVGILAAELGGMFMQRREQKNGERKDASSSSLLAPSLGLLAFVLGITFSITASRFSDRRHLVVNQANAIGTSYLRTNLLPDKQKLETQRLFRQYIDLLVNVSNAQNMEKNLSTLDALQLQIWKQAASLKEEKMDPVLRSLFINSVNQVIDILGERKTFVFIFQIPPSIWTVLLLLYILSMCLAGLEIGPVIRRKNIKLAIVTATFSLIVVLISAIDASTKPGGLTLSQKPMIDVQQMIKNDMAQYTR
jgi:hypothetical protein